LEAIFFQIFLIFVVVAAKLALPIATGAEQALQLQLISREAYLIFFAHKS
jgi:hypothetical protein